MLICFLILLYHISCILIIVDLMVKDITMDLSNGVLSQDSSNKEETFNAEKKGNILVIFLYTYINITFI